MPVAWLVLVAAVHPGIPTPALAQGEESPGGAIRGVIEGWRPEIAGRLHATAVPDGQLAAKEVVVNVSPDGVFVIDGLPAATWQVRIGSPPTRWAPRAWELTGVATVVGSAGRPVQLTLRMDDLPPTRSLRGTVWPPDAQLRIVDSPPPTTWLVNRPPENLPLLGNGGLIDIRVDPDTGEFTVFGLPRGNRNLVLIATAHGHQSREHRLRVGANGGLADVRVWLPPEWLVTLIRAPFVLGFLILMIPLATVPFPVFGLRRRALSVVLLVTLLAGCLGHAVAPMHVLEYWSGAFIGLALVAVVWAVRLAVALLTAFGSAFRREPPPAFARPVQGEASQR